MIGSFPRAKAFLAGRGYDADWFRAALEQRRITPCIPSKTNRNQPVRTKTFGPVIALFSGEELNLSRHWLWQ